MKTVRSLATIVLMLASSVSPALAGQAKVLEADDQNIKIGAGVDRGVRQGMLAEVYRQAAPLIHPQTRENLGSPKVKIARIEITKVGAVSSEGRFIENYAPVQSGDIVESIEVAPTDEDQIRASVAQTRAEIQEIARSLASEIKTNQKAITDLRSTLRRIGSSEQRLKAIANDVRNMRERMVVIESRVVELEDNQQAMIMRDTAEVAHGMPEDMTELRVLRRGLNEEIYLQIGARTFQLSFEDNALIETMPGEEEAIMGEGVDDLLQPLPEEGEESPWYMVYWWIAPVIGVLGAVVIILLRFLKRPAAPSEATEEAAEAAEDDGFASVDDDEGFPEAPEVEADDEIEDFPEEIPEPEEVETAKTEE